MFNIYLWRRNRIWKAYWSPRSFFSRSALRIKRHHCISSSYTIQTKERFHSLSATHKLILFMMAHFATPSLFVVILLISLADSVPATPEDKLTVTHQPTLPTTAHVSLPVYGNWCGPAHGGGICIDSIDCACKTHDLCYDRYGYFNCQCDNDLITSLRGQSGFVALAISAYFRTISCRGPVIFPVIGCKMSLVSWIARSTVTRYTC